LLTFSNRYGFPGHLGANYRDFSSLNLPILDAFIKADSKNPGAPLLLLEAIIKHVKGSRTAIVWIKKMLETGVSLDSDNPLTVDSQAREHGNWGSPLKRIVSRYIYDIVSTKSFPEVVGMNISIERYKALLLILKKYGGVRHDHQPRVIVRKK
jgi:hypothetical protein